MFDIENIILIILLIAICYFIFKITFGVNISEKFYATEDDVIKVINDRYKVNLDNMRKLGSISKDI